MMRLVKRGLMFGNLIEVSSTALVARYNRALKHLTDKQTALTEFHIDISGYSPEIGDELGDDLYLNPRGLNQQFILLTTDQKTAPLLNSKFSTSRSILRSFIEDNEEELFALTAREAVAGELLNSVFDVNEPSDLLNINQIHIEADTIKARVAGAKTLQTHIDKFMNEDDAWWDDVLIANMIGLAKQTGDIQRHPISLNPEPYSQGNYYTSHFGGIYIFRDMETPTVIAHSPVEGLEDMPVENILTFEDRDGIARFLYENGLIDLIVAKRSGQASEIIREKIDFITVAVAAEQGAKFSSLSRRDYRNLERQYAKDLPPEARGLMEIWRWTEMGGSYPRLEPDHPAYFYAFRSTQNKDRDLVNMLLAELCPYDFRQMFICHKEVFYAAYRTWGDTRREFVAQFLEEDYAMDKIGARKELFGEEEVTARVTIQPKSRIRKKSTKSNPWKRKGQR